MNILKKAIKFFIFLECLNITYNFLVMKIYKVKSGYPLRINGRLKVLNKGDVILGKNITINSGANVNIIGGAVRTNIIVREKAFFSIGNNCGISNSTFVCMKSIIIEDDVLIGGDCKIYDTDFHSLDYQNRMNPYINNCPDDNIKTSDILIKQGAWIGGGSIILKGVVIGCKSIVGAGSVVTKNIPDNEIWAGNPAKYIRKIS